MLRFIRSRVWRLRRKWQGRDAFSPAILLLEKSVVYPADLSEAGQLGMMLLKQKGFCSVDEAEYSPHWHIRNRSELHKWACEEAQRLGHDLSTFPIGSLDDLILQTRKGLASR